MKKRMLSVLPAALFYSGAVLQLAGIFVTMVTLYGLVLMAAGVLPLTVGFLWGLHPTNNGLGHNH
jgi:hypothetical protein